MTQTQVDLKKQMKQDNKEKKITKQTILLDQHLHKIIQDCSTVLKQHRGVKGKSKFLATLLLNLTRQAAGEQPPTTAAAAPAVAPAAVPAAVPAAAPATAPTTIILKIKRVYHRKNHLPSECCNVITKDKKQCTFLKTHGDVCQIHFKKMKPEAQHINMNNLDILANVAELIQ